MCLSFSSEAGFEVSCCLSLSMASRISLSSFDSANVDFLSSMMSSSYLVESFLAATFSELDLESEVTFVMGLEMLCWPNVKPFCG